MLINDFKVQAMKADQVVSAGRAKLHNAMSWLIDIEQQHAQAMRDYYAVHGLSDDLCNLQNDLLEELYAIRQTLEEAQDAFDQL